ncbi:MAG: hypothetical protein HOI86_12465 [Tateyamaria sp.]|jgi:hypothetical protein|nr:hypothetical protein [Tateyamaria sp.]MBT6268475.1 hypothetical protein [Tateyamaria sp.]
MIKQIVLSFKSIVLLFISDAYVSQVLVDITAPSDDWFLPLCLVTYVDLRRAQSLQKLPTYFEENRKYWVKL